MISILATLLLTTAQDPACGAPGDPIPFPPFAMTAPHDVLLQTPRPDVMRVTGQDMPSLPAMGTMICGRIVEDGSPTIFTVGMDQTRVTEFGYTLLPFTHGDSLKAQADRAAVRFTEAYGEPLTAQRIRETEWSQDMASAIRNRMALPAIERGEQKVWHRKGSVVVMDRQWTPSIKVVVIRLDE
ncbi:MAG: hypothetical protein AAF830_09455 [Pseudomonadota bacterium]